ncbi:hypothetical protein HYN59_01410 [Flavobacterium album]|uniref:Adenylosuccinate lyase n=1 Tax=Flavobacterium album TaxID=2175091 RepID=A0A2S1QTZ5_9FLAO|nr:hypothetical protein [Flavobacterium album]AWH83854.1 hypothetical protein HYN59_01410 [Flavobacterium album]
MDQQFYNSIVNSTAHRPIRDLLSGQVLDNPELLPDLLHIAFDKKDNSYHKACWILELVMEAKIEWLAPHLDDFCIMLSTYTHEGAIRSISKICLFAVTRHQKQHLLSAKHSEQITEACFDWLIDPNGKVAAKAYAMRALFLIGKKEDWIYPELQRILSEDSVKHTAAYKGAAKDILRRITL